MQFRAGDKIVHGMYGPGEVIRLEEKELQGQVEMCYVVQVKDLTLWVPVNQASPGSLRSLTTRDEFAELFEVLRAAPQAISTDRFDRKTQLTERLRHGSIRSVCEVVRDLSYHRRTKKMNDVDASILDRAQSFLLAEWKLAFSVSQFEAERELKLLLEEGAALESESAAE